MDCHPLLQGIFPAQGLSPGLLHGRQILYHLSHEGSPYSQGQNLGVSRAACLEGCRPSAALVARCPSIALRGSACVFLCPPPTVRPCHKHVGNQSYYIGPCDHFMLTASVKSCSPYDQIFTNDKKKSFHFPKH